MKVKRILIIMITISITVGCFADSENGKKSIEIKGLYHLSGLPSEGLKVEKLDNGNYVFRVVFIDNDMLYEMEWQGAYVQESETNKYVFYWHTGRFDDDMPESNGIIVYELEVTGDGFEGIYFFPEETRTPPARVTYEKID